MRGRLINPFMATIARFDSAATAEDPDGAGPLTTGMDPDFREPTVHTSAEGKRTDARKEDTVSIRCQVEIGTYGELQQLLAGNNPQSRLVLVFHFKDLEEASYVDPETGDALLRINDRLVEIREMSGKLAQAFPRGVYATEVQPQSFGIGRSRNLLLVTFMGRDSTTRT